ncbi:orotidine-5'-phosphate decarboxylase [Candidatus Peregrinibacteria bacterium CG_4_10_14_0_2_um_filter_38_24]|nr:MAG: orotidine-5'-phosphate decarboxylase [Candidatus Peregrinibacteria bacterium CG_4_10_14_0_2_um_filter_38_24]
MVKNFADKLVEAVKAKGSSICVGLDPRLSKIPKFLKMKAMEGGEHTPFGAAASAILVFNKGIIDAVHDIVPVVKPQIAFYEIFGHEGIKCYEETLKYAKSKGLLTIADAKRNDIGSTAEAYAQAFLGETVVFEGEDEVVMSAFDADAVTVTPYLGWDGIKPFIEECRKYGKGIFVLDKTSNPSSSDLQDLEVVERDGADEKKTGKALYEIVGHLIDSWGANDVGENGYSFVGAVTGATFPEQAKRLREIMPNAYFLVPGYGAQGGKAEDVAVCFGGGSGEKGLGVIVNNSRGITNAYEILGYDETKYAEAAREAVMKMKMDLERVL